MADRKTKYSKAAIKAAGMLADSEPETVDLLTGPREAYRKKLGAKRKASASAKKRKLRERGKARGQLKGLLEGARTMDIDLGA